MSTFGRVPVDLVVVDSGPLISLALAGELDLLERFRRPIRILDVVKAECTRFRNKPGANELASWFAANENSRYRTVPTPGHLQRYLETVAKEDAGATDLPSEGIGDEAITWYLANVSKIEKGNDVVLVLCLPQINNPGILMVQSAQNWATENESGCLGGA
jgi:hypothetical protein